MSFFRSKKIGNHEYWYEQSSERIGGKVKTKHVRYIGTTCPTASPIPGYVKPKDVQMPKYERRKLLPHEKRSYDMEKYHIEQDKNLSINQKIIRLEKLDRNYGQ